MQHRLRDIPGNWAIASLHEVCEVLDSRRVPISKAERDNRVSGKQSDDLYPYYGATGQVGMIDDFIFEGEHILVGEDGAPFLDQFKEKAYMVQGKFWVNNHAHIIKSLISNRYVCHYLNFVDYSPHVTGTTRLKLTQRSLKDIPISLPSQAEQYRIAAKIDELFSDLDAGVESLKNARAQLPTYRQAVLKHAFDGTLTAQWRTDSRYRGESATALIARIRRDREAHNKEELIRWEEATLKWKSGTKQKDRPSKPRHSPRPTYLAPEEVRALPALPDGWAWCRIGEIGQVQLGRQRSPKQMSGRYMRPYLRVANVFESRIDTSDVYSMNFNPSEFKTYELKRGDILLNEGQSLELVGRPAMFRGEVAGCCFQNTLVRFRPAAELDGCYALQLFVHYLKSGRFRRIAKWTNNIAHLGARRFADLEFPVCPVPEQHEIARVLHETFKLVERIERDIDAALERTKILRQQILKEAFSGRLVPQDPCDPPRVDSIGSDQG